MPASAKARADLTKSLAGITITVENLIPVMISEAHAWEEISAYITLVMKEKRRVEEEEKSRQTLTNMP